MWLDIFTLLDERQITHLICARLKYDLYLRTPRPATGVSRAPSGPKCPRECPQKRGVSDRVSHGVSSGPFGPLAPECPKSVPRVSRECQKSVPDTPATLSGHFLDTPELGARRAPTVGHSDAHAVHFVRRRFWAISTESRRNCPNRQRTKCTEHARLKIRPSKRLELYIFQNLICARLKYDLYDFFRGCFGPASFLFLV